MAEDWRSTFTAVLLTFLVLKYIWIGPEGNYRFEVGHNHVAYHANWTQTYSDLSSPSEMMRAQQLSVDRLDISLSMSSLSQQEIIALFPHPFRSYKEIKLNLANNRLGSQGADYVLSLIQNGVERLEIIFDSIAADNNLGDVLVKRLSNLNSLRKLKLSLILACKGRDDVLEKYFADSRLSSKLQSYNLVLIGNELSAKAVSHLKQHLARLSLKSLDLNFYSNKLGAEGSQLVSEAIKTQKNLSALRLDFYFNNLTEVGTESICRAVKEINTPSLTDLELNFDFNYIKNEGGKAIGELLSSLKSVTSLHIGVASKNFGYLGYKSIIKGLASMTQLRKLTLRCGVNRVGFNGAEITRDALLKFPDLECLNLNFVENYVGDDGIAILAQTLTHLPKLRHVHLNLGFNDAKSFGLIRVLENLAKCKMDSLYLGLSNNEFRDTDVSLAAKIIPTLFRNYRQLLFEFMETAISKKMASHLTDLFQQQTRKGKIVRIYINSIISEDQKFKENTEEYKTKGGKNSKAPLSNNKSQQGNNTIEQEKQNQKRQQEATKIIKTRESKANEEEKEKLKKDEETKYQAAKEAKEKQERQAKESKERHAKQQAAKEAKEKQERQAKESKERHAKQQAAKEAKEKSERQAKEIKERQVKQQAAKEAKEREERQAKQRAAKEAKEREERQAKQMEQKQANQRAAKEAKEKLQRQGHQKEDKLSQQKSKKQVNQKDKNESNKGKPKQKKTENEAQPMKN